jgi:hypothetical protein
MHRLIVGTLFLFTITLVEMKAFGQQKTEFSFLGVWENDSTINIDSSIAVIHLHFLSERKIDLKITPGNKFRYFYQLIPKNDYYLLRLDGIRKTESDLPVLLFKIVNLNTLKVQFLDIEDIIEWDENETFMNTGILNRKG